MTASVQDSRLKRRFELWDNNGDGAIDRSDYESEARRILQGFGEQENSPKGRALLSAYSTMWESLADKAGTGPQGQVTLEQFIQITEREIVQALASSRAELADAIATETDPPAGADPS